MSHAVILSLLPYTLAIFVSFFTPGPDMLLILRTSFRDGRLAGCGAVLGICISSAVWGIIAGAGLTALVAASRAGFMILLWAGAFYLAWMGIKLIRRPGGGPGELAGETIEKLAEAETARLTLPGPGFWRSVLRGWMTDMLNPYVGVFMLTFYPQFIPLHASVPLFVSILTGIQILADVVCFMPLVFMGEKLGVFFSNPKVAAWLDRISGVIFVVFAVKLVCGAFFS